MARLPVSCAPMNDESLLGFVLRLSSANFYHTPRYICYEAGAPRSQWNRPSAGFPALSLVPLIGGYEPELDCLNYRKSVGGAVRYYLLGHDLGRSADMMRLAEPVVCVQCVREDRYQRAYFDLSASVACPRHGCLVTQVCPGCRGPLIWYRHGLLECQCGTDLSVAETYAADAKLIELMRLIEVRLEDRSCTAGRLEGQIPAPTLEVLPLSDLLKVVDVLGKAGVGCGESLNEQVSGLGKVRAATRILTDWPSGLRQWMVSLKALNGADPLPSPIYAAYQTLFKHRWLSEGMRALKADFLQASSDLWAVAENVNRMCSARAKASGAVVPRRRLSEESLKRPAPGVRKVAKLLGIPESTLHVLRDRGLYGKPATPGRRQLWGMDDAGTFAARLRALVPEIACSVGTRLDVLLGLKFRNPAAKADLIEAVLTRKIRVIGSDGGKAASLLLDVEQTEQFIHMLRVREGDGTYSFPEAAAEIGLEMGVIGSAVTAGLLESVLVDGRIRVTRASIQRFRELHVPVVEIARSFGTTSHWLAAHIEGLDIDVIKLARPSGGIPQPVVARNELPRIDAAWAGLKQKEASLAAPRTASPQESPVARLQAYLDRMARSGERLPRHGGKLDRARIARECRIVRDNLYTRQELVDVLASADLRECKALGVESLAPASIVRAYLEACRAAGTRLPRNHLGHPNKVAIAKACELSPSVIYGNQVVAGLLAEFDRAEQADAS